MKGFSIAYLIVTSLAILMTFSGGDDVLVGLLALASFGCGYTVSIMALGRK